MANENRIHEVDWAALLREAVTVPGRLAACYSAFWNYSIGNMLLAFAQCYTRGINIGPIATYNKWIKLGRQVQRGQKAIVLCQPVKTPITRENAQGQPETVTITRFVFRPSWFVLDQTAPIPGAEPEETRAIPSEWDVRRAADNLKITITGFNHPDGNCQGYALPKERTIAINPVAGHPCRTAIHEMAHVLLHNQAELPADLATITVSERELEAESVAYLVASSLGLPGADESRGYIQHWYGIGKEIPSPLARRIMTTADSILKAGRGDMAAAAE